MKKKGIFTSVVRTKNNDKYRVIPVKSSEEVNVELWQEFSKILSRIYANIPIECGDVICSNILNTGIDILCTRSIEKDI
ncbi:MAG: DUF1667 domain-containing protein [Clostridiaceae bacterium]